MEAEKSASRMEPGRIFVGIPAYRDSEAAYTIRDLFEKAHEPEKVVVGVLWQGIPEDDQHCFVAWVGPSFAPNKVRRMDIHASQAKGPAYARYLIQKHLYEDSQ